MDDKKNKKLLENEPYQVKVENNGHFLYYKGEKLPLQRESVITQGVEDFSNGICWATITVRAVISND